MKINNEIEKKSIKNVNSNKTPIIVGVVGAATAIVGGVVGYNIAKSKLKKEYKESLHEYLIPKSLLSIIVDIHKNSDVKLKMIEIDKKINSNNWIEIHGAILACFSEFEFTLTQLCLSKIPDIKPKDNYHKKIGQLNHHNIISPSEYDILKKLGDIRNNLVHGKYENVEMNDIKGSFYIINEFIDNHYIN